MGASPIATSPIGTSPIATSPVARSLCREPSFAVTRSTFSYVDITQYNPSDSAASSGIKGPLS
jgi:hypothetical protein